MKCQRRRFGRSMKGFHRKVGNRSAHVEAGQRSVAGRITITKSEVDQFGFFVGEEKADRRSSKAENETLPGEGAFRSEIQKQSRRETIPGIRKRLVRMTIDPVKGNWGDRWGGIIQWGVRWSGYFGASLGNYFAEKTGGDRPVEQGDSRDPKREIPVKIIAEPGPVTRISDAGNFVGGSGSHSTCVEAKERSVAG